jgi:hypothetical protein
MIPASEGAKTAHALDHAATVTGIFEPISAGNEQRVSQNRDKSVWKIYTYICQSGVLTLLFIYLPLI